MYAHDQLTREELFQLKSLKHKIILGDDVELSEVLVLLELLQHNLLLSISFLQPPKLLKVRLADKNDLSVVLHDRYPAKRR